GNVGASNAVAKLSSCNSPNVFAESTFADFGLDGMPGTRKETPYLRCAARCAASFLVELHGLSLVVFAVTAKVASRLLQYTGGIVRSSFVAGSFSLEDDVSRLREDAPQLLFATPWRLARHLETTPHFVSALQSVELLVLDEADRLLDPSFVYKVDYLMRCLPTPRPRMVLCSATFSEPIRKFAVRSLRANLQMINLGTKEPISSASPYQADVAEPVHQVLVRYQSSEFLATLHAALEQEMGKEGQLRRVLVVFPTVRWLQFFYVLLKHRAQMPGLFALHRSLSDDRRRTRSLRFSKGAPPIRGALFATDLAARGMDFDVHAVIQVGPPTDREQYVHRAGRTGRLSSQGRSLLLLNSMEETSLQELTGLQLQEEQLQAAPSFQRALSEIHGWWQDASLSASGHLFFASAIAFYLNESQRLRARAVDVVQTVAALLQSTGLPQDYGLPAIPRGLAARLREKDELVAVRTETVRERWDVLSALGPGTMRKHSDEEGDAERGDARANDTLQAVCETDFQLPARKIDTIRWGLWSPNDRQWLEELKELWQDAVAQLGSAPGLDPRPAIPQCIHQIWLGGRSRPEPCEGFTASWRSRHPGWEYRLWTDADVAEELTHPGLAQAYEAASNPAEKSDILRLAIILRHGGLYVDVDFECLQPLGALHSRASFYCGLSNVGAVEVNNGLFAATPGHPLVSYLCDRLGKPWPEWGQGDVDPQEAVAYQIQRSGMLEMPCEQRGKAAFLATTGPGFFTRGIMKGVRLLKGKQDLAPILICPPEVFYPLANTERGMPDAEYRTPHSLAVHHWFRQTQQFSFRGSI
ncbi:RH31, partial [Symbiodinium pilosum]